MDFLLYARWISNRLGIEQLDVFGSLGKRTFSQLILDKKISELEKFRPLYTKAKTKLENEQKEFRVKFEIGMKIV